MPSRTNNLRQRRIVPATAPPSSATADVGVNAPSKRSPATGLNAEVKKRRAMFAMQHLKSISDAKPAVGTPVAPTLAIVAAPLKGGRASVGSVVLTMLKERDAEKAAIAKEAKAEAKAAVAAAPAAAATAGAAGAAPTAVVKLAASPAAKQSPRPKLTPEKPEKRLQPDLPNTSTPTIKAHRKDGAASWSVERSRSQVLCRTGKKGPGQTVAMKYGDGKPYRNQDAAVAAARKWWQLIRQG